MFDADGQMVGASEWRPPDFNIIDRQYFQDARRQRGHEFAISDVVYSKVNGYPGMVAYRAIVSAGGGFRGVVAIPIDLRHFSALFGQLRTGSGGLVLMLRTDTGRTVLRWPDIPSAVNVEQTDLAAVMAVQEGRESGLARFTSHFDGIDRMVAFEVIRGFPFVAVAGRSVGSIYRNWWTTAIVSSLAAFLVLLLVGLLLANYRRFDAAQRTSDARYRAIVEEHGDAVCRWLPDTTLTFANDTYRRYFERPGATLVGMKWLDLIPPEDRAAAEERLGHQRSRLERTTHELWTRCADGAMRYLQWMTMPLLDQSRSLVEFQSVGRDATEAKKSIDEVEAHELNLEGVVRQRTEQLARAKEQAEAANVAKSVFLANMSHEIRTPLNAVLGMAHLLRHEQLSPTQEARLQRIENAGQHLLEMLNAVLELSKIEAGKFDLREERLDLGELVHGTVALLQDQATSKGLRLMVEIPAFGHAFLGDATRLRDALLNYVNNAIRFTAAGRIVVRARLVAEQADRTTIRFEVQDTGHGIAPGDLTRLFTAFEQVDNSSTRRHGGTGLGLAITKRLAQLMDGDAGAESTVGAGSTFWFTVQLKKADRLPARGAIVGASDACAAVKSEHGGEQVLLVEDDALNADVTRFLLEDAGLVVATAEDGVAAVGQAAGQRFDLVLMDLQLPRLDGFDAARRIRQLPGYADVPIIALTANVFSDERSRCFDAGMNDFLPKPLQPVALYAALRQWLRPRPR